MKKATPILALLLAIVMVFGLTACGKSPEKPGTDNQVSQQTSEPGNQQPDDQQPVDQGPKTLRVALSGEPTSLCELIATGAQNSPTSHLLYDTLVWRNSQDGKVYPALADSWEILDNRTAVFHLKKDAKAIDGSPITAEDVLFSLKSARDCTTTLVSAYVNYDIDACEIIDEHTIKIVASHDYSQIVNLLGNRNFLIYSKSLVEAAGGFEAIAQTGAAATGPYKLVEWIPGDHITLTRNEYYHGEPGYYDNIELYFISDGATRAMALQSGQVDFIYGLSPALIADIENAEGLKVIQTLSGSVLTMFFNARDNEALRDVRVRKAIAYGINKDAIVEVAYSGVARAADSLVPANSPYYTEMDPYYNPEEAKRLLAEAGYGDGLTLHLLALQSESKLCEIMNNQLAQIGINLDMTIVDVPNVVKASQAGEYDLFIFSRFGSDPSYSIYALDGRRPSPKEENFTMLDDPSIYNLLDIVYSSTDVNAGRAAMHELDLWNAENFFTLPLIDSISLFGAKENIDGVYLDYNGMHPFYGKLFEK